MTMEAERARTSAQRETVPFRVRTADGDTVCATLELVRDQ